MDEERDYLELAKMNWAEGGEKDSDALWPIAAALVSIAESHKRVADALEKIHNDIPAEQLATIAEAVDMIAQGDALPPQR